MSYGARIKALAPVLISPVRADEVTHLREDLLAPTPPIEDAVVSDPRLHVMRFALGGNPAAELQCRLGLARGADIVVLALDAEQRRPGDRRRLDLAAARDEAAGR